MTFSRKSVQIGPELGATLDFLRWTSALAVLTGHVRIFLFPPLENAPNAGIALKTFYILTGFGNQAVMVFFVLSGFLVGGRVLEKLAEGTFHMTEYLVDRVSRLYPVLITSLVLTATLDMAGTKFLHDANCYPTKFQMLHDLVNYDVSNQLSIGTFFSNLFMLQGLATAPFGTNGPLWSLSMEFWYYLLFPLLLLPFYQGCGKWRRRCVAFLVPVLLLLAKNPNYYALFVVWLLGVLARRVSVPFSNSTVAFALLFLALVNSRIGFGPDYFRSVLIGVGSMLVIIAVLNGGWGIAWGGRLSNKMANFSYTLYCCHFPLVVLATAMIASHQTMAALSIRTRLLLAAALTSLCLILCYFLSLLTEARTPYFRQKLRQFITTFVARRYVLSKLLSPGS